MFLFHHYTPKTKAASSQIIYHIAVGSDAQQTAECDYWRDAGKEEKEDRGETLDVEAVFDVAPVHRITTLHVTYETAAKPAEIHVPWHQRLNETA